MSTKIEVLDLIVAAEMLLDEIERWENEKRLQEQHTLEFWIRDEVKRLREMLTAVKSKP